MDLYEFKKEYVRKEIGATETFGDIYTFIDFGNVNHWFDEDRQDWNNKKIGEGEKLGVDIDKLKDFAELFSTRTRCYYGKDPKNEGSRAFYYALKKVFGKHHFVSKDVQKIKHYIKPKEAQTLKLVRTDGEGKSYVEIRKSNFDVEISVDAIKKIDKYDTFCLFSGDADFVYLNNFLRKRGKKIILVKAGYITNKLRKSVGEDGLVINAQRIKRHIARIEQRPD